MPIWTSGFRPFFLLGALYGAAIVVLWLGARTGAWQLTGGVVPLSLVHGHELVYGFSVAIVCGITLTALPSWSGTIELRGAPLAVLATLWIAGRAAFLLLDDLPATLVMIADCALVPALVLMTVRGLLQARPRLFLWTLPPLIALAVGNVLFHDALADNSPGGMRSGVMLGLYGLLFLYSLYGGLLTPAFTRNFLLARGEPAAGILMPLEYATALAMVALAGADLLDAPLPWRVAAGSIAIALHVWRFARWRGWRTGGEPLLWTLHAGYAWLIAALVLLALAELTAAIVSDAWIHAFTLGALGLTMGGLMTRVTLRHTGRPPQVAPIMRVAYGMLLIAPLLRLAYALRQAGEWAVFGSSALWTGAFLIYLVRYGPMLITPSLAGSAAASWGPRPRLSE